MKPFILALVTCGLLGCEVSRTTQPNKTSVNIDIGKGGVNVEVKKD